MKTLALILLFSISVHGQKTNEPNIVYPLLEQFISEAYNRDIPVYHKQKPIYGSTADQWEIVDRSTEVAPIPEPEV